MVALILLACSEPVVVVVGGGPAGMAAALQASEGAKVVLYEGEAQLGGSAAYAEAITALPAAWPGNEASERYVREVRPQVVDWLGGLGVMWQPAPNSADEVELLKPVGGGLGLVQALQRALEEAGVEVRLGQRVGSLQDVVPAKAIVLATGGWMGDAEAVSGWVGGEVLRGAPRFADGNGLALAQGDFSLPTSPLLYGHGTPSGDKALMVLGAEDLLVLDAAGQRVRLGAPRGDTGTRLLGRQAELIVDPLQLERLSFFDWEAHRMVRAHGQVTERELDPWIAEGERTGDKPLFAKGPYTAIPLRPTTAKGLSGLSVDLEGRVLSGGVPVPHLYAAGELTGFGAPYQEVLHDSTMVAGAVLTGRVAARTALSEL